MSKTPLSKNRVVIASAGSGKTSRLVDEALAIKDKKILITTYTNENLDQINSYFVQQNGFVPANVTVLSWYSFLLQHGVRPYQNYVTTRNRVNSIFFDVVPDAIKFTPKSNVDMYYFTKSGLIYRDRVAEFISQTSEVSNGLVISRLERIFDYIFIDEIQDLSGYDLVILESLLRSSLIVTGVGDPRQATFTTNYSRKNAKYKRTQISDWISEKEKRGLLTIEELSECHRCNQIICDYADALYPDMPKTSSLNSHITGHDGVFFITEVEALPYYEGYKPVVLRNNKNSNTLGLPSMNIGVSKGRTFERVLVFPTAPMKKYFTEKNPANIADRARLYVAITRAKYSVAFVL